MFGTRKLKARIAELEAQLVDAHENLAVAIVPGEPISQRVTVRKGQWYTASFRFRHNGSDTLDLAQLFVGSDVPDDGGEYFRGGVVM